MDSAERSQRLLQRIDLDSDGLISRSENDVHALREFNTLDRDGNGFVGPPQREFTAARWVTARGIRDCCL